MEKSYFKCFRLFLETGKKINDMNLKAQYYESLLEYGLDGVKPSNPLIDALLTSAMYSIDKSDGVSEIRSENGKKHSGNQYTKGDTRFQAQKKAVEQNGTTVEQNGTGRIEEKKNIEEYRSIEDINIKKEKINKKKFLDFVLLTDDEHSKLIEQLGTKLTTELIDKLNNYIGSTGKRYKSHYFTILNRSKKESTTTVSVNDKVREMQRQIRLEQAREVLNHNNSDNGESIQGTSFNRRTD